MDCTMCSAISDNQALRALQTLQGFTSQRVVTVIGQEEQLLIVNSTVHSRIRGALYRRHPMGIAADNALAELQAYIGQGGSLHELVAANRKMFATADKLIRSDESDKVHTDLGARLILAEPLHVITAHDKPAIAAAIEPYARKAKGALAGDTRAGKSLVKTIRDIGGDPETRDRFRHFGAFVMLCVGTGASAGAEILDVARGKLRMPYMLGRKAIRSTLHFMEDVGFQALSTEQQPLGNSDMNFYPTWSQAFVTRA